MTPKPLWSPVPCNRSRAFVQRHHKTRQASFAGHCWLQCM